MASTTAPTASQLDDAISTVFAAGSRMVIDLTAVSSILSSLLRAREQANQQAADDLVIVAPTGTMPRRVIETLGLATRLPVYENREAALAVIP